jgi:hypothetical protein
VRLVLAGCPFRVGPDAALAPGERARLEALARTATGRAFDVPEFRLTLVDEPPWPGASAADYEDHVAASVRVEGGRVRVTHRRHLAELDVEGLEGRLQRATPGEAAVEIALRVALSARLPSLGGLPLHAAGLVLGGAGLAFFGPSGAGKSTLSALAPGPVLSDELVAVTLGPPRLRATGFWGVSDSADPPPAEAPLAALVELARGPAFRLESVAPDEAFRRLMGVLLVPPLTRPWQEAMALLARAVREVPVHRMHWSPDEPPWDRLRRAILNPAGAA